MKTVIYDALALIKKHEQFKKSPYKNLCAKDAIGFNCTSKDIVKLPLITKACANDLLISDLILIERDLKRLCGKNLNRNQLAALISYVHSIGRENFKGSKLYRKLEDNNFNELSNCFYDLTPLAGVSKDNKVYKFLLRRNEEVGIFFTPVATTTEKVKQPPQISVERQNTSEGIDTLDKGLNTATGFLNRLQGYVNKVTVIVSLLVSNKTKILALFAMLNIHKIIDCFNNNFKTQEVIVGYFSLFLLAVLLLYILRKK